MSCGFRKLTFMYKSTPRCHLIASYKLVFISEITQYYLSVNVITGVVRNVPQVRNIDLPCPKGVSSFRHDKESWKNLFYTVDSIWLMVSLVA